MLALTIPRIFTKLFLLFIFFCSAFFISGCIPLCLGIGAGVGVGYVAADKKMIVNNNTFAKKRGFNL